MKINKLHFLLFITILFFLYSTTGCKNLFVKEVNEYTLTINIIGSGLVIKKPNPTKYISGTIVELTAEPDTGWYFDHWENDATGSTNVVYVTIDSDKTIQAVFKESVSYTLNGSWRSTDSNDVFVESISQLSQNNKIEIKEKDVSITNANKKQGDFNSIILKYRKNSVVTNSLSSKIRTYGKEIPKVNKIDFRISVIKPDLTKGKNLEEILEYYNSLPEIEYAEPDYYVYALGSPNDPYYSYQWHFIQLNMSSVWDTIIGNSNIIVAVIDTGVAYDLDDFGGTLFTTGKDYVNNDSDPYDDNSHGTHVTGTIAQTTNNNTGVAGMAYGVTIMPIKVLGQDGSGSWSNVAAAIIWAADNGADIINLSLGGPHTQTAYEACQYAYQKGATIFAGSGNNNSTVLYPAAYDDYVLAVGATRYDKQRAPYSNYGPELDVVAPGGDLSVDQNNDGYGDGVLQQTIEGYDPNTGTTNYTPAYYFFQGTSMATPHVSALAALLKSQDPTLSADEIYFAIKSKAEDLGLSGRDDYFGYGIIDPASALSIIINTYKITDSITDYLDPVNNKDEWQIQISSGATIDISLLFSHLEANLDLYLYDSSGAIVGSSKSYTDNESLSYFVDSNDGIYKIGVEYVQ